MKKIINQMNFICAITCIIFMLIAFYLKMDDSLIIVLGFLALLNQIESTRI